MVGPLSCFDCQWYGDEYLHIGALPLAAVSSRVIKYPTRFAGYATKEADKVDQKVRLIIQSGTYFTANRNRDLGEDRFPVPTFEDCESVIQTEMAEVFLFTRQESTTPGKFLINNTAKTNSEKVYKIYDNLASKNEEVVH